MTESKWLEKLLVCVSACVILFSGGCGGDSGSSGASGRPADSRGVARSAVLTGKIVFHQDSEDGLYVYSISADGSGQKRLTDSLPFGWSAWNPAWSPDGTQFVYQATNLPLIRLPNIWIAAADGSSSQQLTDYRAPLPDPPFPRTWRTNGSDVPAWSPTGDLIAYSSYLFGNGDIYTVRSDGSSDFIPTQLTSDPELDYSPAWSQPDRAKIAFTTYRTGNSEIFVMNADGSNPVNLTNNPSVDAAAAWSPAETKQIAFSSERDGNSEIYLMDPDGLNQRNISNNPAYDGLPIWSPDGNYIAFVSNRDGYFTFYTMELLESGEVGPAEIISSGLVSTARPEWTSQ